MTATALRIRSGPRAGFRQPLTAGTRLTLGRSRDCEVPLEDDGASRHHAALEVGTDTVTVTDLDSANGTRIDGRRIDAPTPLPPGAMLQIGRTHLSLEARPTAIDQDEPPTIPGYRLIERVGSGPLGTTWRARRSLDQSTVAVKVLSRELTADPAVRARVINGARAAARLDQANIQAILESDRAGEDAFVVTPWAAHGSLADLLAEEAALPSEVIAAIGRDAARGLAAADAAGLAHPGLEADDILLDADGVARIADLGLAGAGGDVRCNPLATEEVAGLATDARSNQYHLGAILHRALGGADAPGRSRRLGELTGVDPTLARLVARLTASDPDDRFPDWNAVLAAFDAALARSPTGPARLRPSKTTRRAPSARPPRPRQRRERMPPTIAALVILILMLLGSLVLLALLQRSQI